MTLLLRRVSAGQGHCSELHQMIITVYTFGVSFCRDVTDGRILCPSCKLEDEENALHLTVDQVSKRLLNARFSDRKILCRHADSALTAAFECADHQEEVST